MAPWPPYCLGLLVPFPLVIHERRDAAHGGQVGGSGVSGVMGKVCGAGAGCPNSFLMCSSMGMCPRQE